MMTCLDRFQFEVDRIYTVFMPGYVREDPHFALCGLDCCLCPRFHTEGSSRCPGCGGPGFLEKHPTCAVVTCSRKHGGVEFCFDCSSYPCERYAKPNEADSFITYRNVAKNLASARNDLASYRKELNRRFEILTALLETYNDGRSKGLYCLAANLLPLEELSSLMEKIERDGRLVSMDKKAAAKEVAALLTARAEELKIELKLRR